MARSAVAVADIAQHKSKGQAKKEATVEVVTNRLLGEQSIGGMTDKLIALRDTKRDLETKIKAIEAESEVITEALMEKAEREGIDKGTGKTGTFSITANTVANVVDWDALNAYIKKTGHFHLYQRRVSDPAYRELLEAGKKVPGVDPFTKKRLNLRALSAGS